MAADGSIVIDVELDSRDAEKAADNLGSKFDGAFQDKKGRWRAANGRFLTMKERAEMLGKSVGGIKGAGERAAFGIGKVVKALGLVALGVAAVRAVRDALDGAIDRYDTLNAFPRVMQQMGFDADESKKAIDKLSSGIEGLPTTLDSVAKTAQRIAIMTGDLEGATDTTLALNNAFLASGSSSADAERGLDQYVQMLAKGEVDLQSWRTLQETMGVGLNETAKAFGFAGKSAQNDLYDALKEGDITFDEFNGKLIELSNKTGGFADIARESSGGIKTSWTNMKTAIVKGVADVIGAIDEALGGVGSIEGIIDKMKTGIQAAFRWIVGAIPVVAGAIQSFVDKVRPVAEMVFDYIAAAIPVVTGAIQALVDRITSEKDRFHEVFITIQNVVMAVLNAVVPFIQEKLALIQQFWQENGTQILEAVTNAFNMIKAVIDFVMPAVLFVVEYVWTAIQQVISGALDVIMGLVKIFTGLFTGDWSKMWEGVKQLFKGAIDLIIGWFSLTFVGGLRTMLVNLGKTSISTIRGMWTKIVEFFKTFGTRSQETVSRMATAVVKFFSNILSRAQSIFGTLRTFGASVWSAIRQVITNAVRGAYEAVRSRFTNMLSSVRNLMGNVRTTIQDLWGKAVAFLQGINLKEIGKDIIRGLINGIGSMASAVWDKAKEIAGGITGSIKKVLGVASPSRVMIQVGKWTGEGLAIGMDKLVGDVERSAKHLASAAVPDIAQTSFSNPLRGVRAPLGNLSPFGASGVSGDPATQYQYNTVNMDGLFNGATFQVREEQDIRKLAKHLNDYIRMESRKGGVVMP